MASSIHGLRTIIESLELRMSKFKVDNPTDKQLQSLELQSKLINDLTEIYETFEGLTLYDTFCEIQREADGVKAKDPHAEGLAIRIPFKENSKLEKYALID